MNIAMTKTLGQIAYEAAGEIWKHDNEAAWQAAAEAVAREMRLRGQVDDGCPRCLSFSKSEGIISLDSLPPMLTETMRCSNGHRWTISWEGE